MAKEIAIEKITYDDFNNIYKLMNTESIYKFIKTGIKWPAEKVNKFIEYCYSDETANYPERNSYFWKISINGKFAGFIGVSKTHNAYFTTTALMEEYQGHGIGTKSAELMIAALSSGVKDNLYSDVLTTNVKSIKSIEKLNTVRTTDKVMYGNKKYYRYKYLY